MPLLTLPSHVASPIARAVQIGLPVRAPRSGCCHFVGSAGSSRLQTGTTGRAVVESSGLCLVIRLFGMPIAARLLRQQVLSVTCSPLRWYARRCCSRAGPYPDCRFQVCLGPTFALKSRGQLPLSLHRRGLPGPLAADLSNRTRRAVGAKDGRTPPGLRRGQVRTALAVGVADGKAGGPRRSQTGTAGLSVPGHAGRGRRAAPRNADCNSQMTADCKSS